MQYLDEGRKADLAFIDKNLKRRDLSEEKRKQLENGRYQIDKQSSNAELFKMRSQMNRARASGDGREADKIMERIIAKYGQ